ncbi:hypothetical protein CRYUN_Cryun39dG0004300 [Craigia yunnanensis]
MLNYLEGAVPPNVPRPPPSTEKQKENQAITNNDAQCSVTSIYCANIADLYRLLTATWCKSLINHSFTINVENPSDDQSHCTYKIDLKAWQFWGRKGLKSLEVNGNRAKLDEGKQKLDIMIENSLSGPDDPEMWVSIDSTAVIRIMNLH